ncbi:MAG: amino acid synthesis family protein [bacterium]|tara:strand:+ start:302 stop:886 length:585 start_codon:yes stop_codon:yes gene_type:complete
MSNLIKVRKIVTHIENIYHEGGQAHSEPIKKGAVLIVLKNPYAGSYVEDITPMMEALKPIGLDAANQLIELLGGVEQIQSYGKGSIVGEAGELEHGALWHVPGGYAMREALGGALAIVPSAKKVGGIGSCLDIPITHINASYVRSHFDAMEVYVQDAPRSNELIYGLVMTTGGRTHPRVGGLEIDQISVNDGQR